MSETESIPNETGSEEKVGPALTAESGSGETAGIGQRLRSAREAAGMSIADVALALRYSARQVELLEADDYTALPGNTVVRGFTRSYARLLGLDADAMLHQLAQALPSAVADVRPPANMGIAADHEGGLRLSPVASAAIVLVLAALLLALWHFFGPKSAGKPAVNGERSVAQIQSQPQPQSQESAPAAALPPGASPAAGMVAEAAPPGGPVLTFVFEDRSWLEVTDASRQIIHTGENPGGTRLTLTGKPPFDIVVGNAGKVKLSYGERSIDLAPHTRAEVARLKLEE